MTSDTIFLQFPPPPAPIARAPHTREATLEGYLLSGRVELGPRPPLGGCVQVNHKLPTGVGRRAGRAQKPPRGTIRPALSLFPQATSLLRTCPPPNYSPCSAPGCSCPRKGCFPRQILRSSDHRLAQPARRFYDAAIQKVYICPRLAGPARSGGSAAVARLSLRVRPRGRAGGEDGTRRAPARRERYSL